MELGLIGLGRMGANMAQRLVLGGHRVVTYDLDPAAITASVGFGAEAGSSLEDLVRRLEPPKSCVGHGAPRPAHRGYYRQPRPVALAGRHRVGRWQRQLQRHHAPRPGSGFAGYRPDRRRAPAAASGGWPAATALWSAETNKRSNAWSPSFVHWPRERTGATATSVQAARDTS